MITDRDSVGDLSDAVRGLVLDYLAAAIDPATATIFTHSSVPALNQLLLPLLSSEDRIGPDRPSSQCPLTHSSSPGRC